MFKSDAINPRHMGDEMTLQKNVLDGKYIDVLSLATNPAFPPQFFKTKDAYIPKREQNFMSYPIFTPNGDIYMNI